MYLVGIDVGYNNCGLGIINYNEKEKIINIVDLVYISFKKNKYKSTNKKYKCVKGNVILCASNIIKHYSQKNNLIIVIEKVHTMPHDGRISAFNFGYSYGLIKGICEIVNNGKNIYEFHPNKWKKYVGLTSNKEQVIERFLDFTQIELDEKQKKKLLNYNHIIEAFFIAISFLAIKNETENNINRNDFLNELKTLNINEKIKIFAQ